MIEEWRSVPGYEGRYEVSSANNTYVTPQGHRRCRACARERRSMGE